MMDDESTDVDYDEIKCCCSSVTGRRFLFWFAALTALVHLLVAVICLTFGIIGIIDLPYILATDHLTMGVFPNLVPEYVEIINLPMGYVLAIFPAISFLSQVDRLL